MAYLDKFRAFVQGLIDECQEVEKVNELNGILNEITDKDTGYENLLNEYKKLLKNHETQKVDDYAGMGFDEMLKEFSNK